MHALKIDPKLYRPQRWAQVCFYGCIALVCVQTLLVVRMPFCAECECKEVPSESDVVFDMKNQTLAGIVIAIRYLALLGPYGDFTAGLEVKTSESLTGHGGEERRDRSRWRPSRP